MARGSTPDTRGRAGAARPDDRARSRNVRALGALVPFMRPYAGQFALALAALVFTATLSLILPLAVRRVVDGFGAGLDAAQVALLDRYFAAALGIAALLALGTGARYYFVSRLGERVVADIRRAVFDRVIGMSPAFYERLMTGEVLSRITTDTTLLLSVIGSSVSLALRNLLLLAGGLALLIWTSPKLSGLVLLLVPAVIAPILLMGRRLRRLGRENQDLIAESAGSGSELLLAVQTVQAFTHEAPSRARFGGLTEAAYLSARKRIGTRAVMTVLVMILVFGGIVGVLWVGARDVAEGTMTIGELVQFLIYAILVAGSVSVLSEIRARSSAPPAPRSGWWSSWRRATPWTTPRPPWPCPSRCAGASSSRRSPSPTPRGSTCRRSTRSPSRCAPARRWRSSAPRARARRPCSSSCCASTTQPAGPSASTACRPPPWRGPSSAGRSRSCPRIR